MIGVIDYNLGNISSIINIYSAHDISVSKIENPAQLDEVSGIILPGVGSFDNAVNLLKTKNLFNKIKEVVIKKKIPILGICIGMQLLCNYSEEGFEKGLSLLDTNIEKINSTNESLITPHMGWNEIDIKKKDLIFENIHTGNRFYFLHSYCCKSDNNINALGQTFYGEFFNSVISYKHIYGIQFHPEKSHAQGEQILINFKKVCY